jgi:all-trans-8'-apo-beta-carotenal 15,15'-oxygenase
LHWLDGDGYVLAFSFPGDGGEPAIRSRYVDTHERVAEQAAGRVLYRNTFGTQPLSRLNAGDIGLKNPANTNVVYWGGKLLALWEAGAPYELLPGSLETVGPADLDGWVAVGRCPSSTGIVELDAALGFGAAHTAHPHVIQTAEGASRLASWKWQSKVSLTGGTSLCAEFREFDENWAVKSGR